MTHVVGKGGPSLKLLNNAMVSESLELECHKKVLPEHFQVDGFHSDTVEQPKQPLAKKLEIKKSKKPY